MPLTPTPSLTSTQLERYSRHILLKEVGGQGQQKLLNARVLIVGAGGLGSPILLYLAAAGVGTIGLVDDDEVSLSNLQRQILHTTDQVGCDKLDSAARAMSRLNPDIRLNHHKMKLNHKNAGNLIASYDLVVEGVDNFQARFDVNRAAIGVKKPFISAAVGRFEGQLSTFKPYDAPGQYPCYRCLVPEEPPRDMQVTCAEEGILGAVTGVVGSLAAMEVLKEILGIGTSLAGRLLIYDGLSATTRTVKLSADPQCKDCGHV